MKSLGLCLFASAALFFGFAHGVANAQAAPTPSPSPYERYVQLDYYPALVVYNELSPGNVGTGANLRKGSTGVQVGLEFRLWKIPLVAIGEDDQFAYPHNTGLVTVINQTQQHVIPAFTATEYDLGARLGVQFAPDHWYASVAYLYHSTNYGEPDVIGGGFGVEKLPDFSRRLSFSGSLYYYPELHNPHPFPRDDYNIRLAYHVLTYGVQANWSFSSHLSASLGWYGDDWYNTINAPSNAEHFGPRLSVAANI